MAVDRENFVGSEMLAALQSTLPDDPGIVAIHSSFSSLRPPADFRPANALYAIDQLVRKGWTVAIPSFTFSFCSSGIYSPRETRSEVGPLADWVLNGLIDARRTSHPIYSFVVIGPRRDSLLACSSESVFGEGSTFEYLETQNAQVLMLGCGWDYCTPFHRHEELARVPYRYLKNFVGQLCINGQSSPLQAQMYVRNLELAPVNDFSPAVDALRARALITTASLWQGQVEGVSLFNLADICAEQIAENSFIYLKNSSQVECNISAEVSRSSTPADRIAILGHSNLELLRAFVNEELAIHSSDTRTEVHTVPYGQLDQQILTSHSELTAFGAKISVFVDRLEDLAGAVSLDDVDPALFPDLVESYAAAIVAHAAESGGWIFVFRFAQLQGSSRKVIELQALLNDANARLAAALSQIPQLAWLDPGQEAALDDARAFDARLWHLGRFPFSRSLTRRLARRIAGYVLATSGRTARLVVLDLDNTLWGGVLGEDGIEGIVVGGDYPGNAYKAFQRALKNLSARGIALAVASKNDPDAALQALDAHPEMLIRSTDLVGSRIGWAPKTQGIASLCNELSLGQASALFVDDNPVEREAVRLNLPLVKILDLPTDPTDYVRALLDSPYLAVIDVTAEDLGRVNSYKARAQIEKKRTSVANMEDFYRSLGMTIYIQPLDAANLARAAQLCKKTNQFNTTTRRYESSDLVSMAREGSDVLVIGLSDKHSERENIGLLILAPMNGVRDEGMVDLFLLSCRVLGRGVEHVVISWALQRAHKRNWRILNGLVVETPKNTPARDIFLSSGFQFDDGLWHVSTEAAPSIPDWVCLLDLTSVPHKSAPKSEAA